MSNRSSLREQGAQARIGRALAGAIHLGNGGPGESGFLTVPDGIDALAIRLMLADRAEISIDTQYYEIEDDLAGRLFIEALLRAADRGVRVRLLIDDYQTEGFDARMSALNHHPLFEVRIYNAFVRRSRRVLEGLTSFTRINRRMHNKSFTVDGQMTVIGGRNIGDHYFSVGEKINFADLDVVAIGPIVAEISEMFSEYWESQAATPIDRIASSVAGQADETAARLSRILAQVTRTRERVGETRYAEAVERSIVNQLDKDISAFTWAPYRLVYDSPQKTQKGAGAEAATSVRSSIADAFDAAKREVLMISPYFVPRRAGVTRFKGLRNRGVEVTVVTNSLASNNQTYAHGGYAAVRKPLLRMGVKLHEMRADAHAMRDEPAAWSETKATLHTKAFVIDRAMLFVGSFNFDPRSANLNTEMGVLIDSPELAVAIVEGASAAVPRGTYEVILGDDRALRWRGRNGEEEVILDREPQASFWLRVAGGICRILPIRGQV